MSSNISAEQHIVVGEASFIDSTSPQTQYAVVFEDDGDTGYFYGLDTALVGQQIIDAMHIYNVKDVTDKDKRSLIQITWSNDGMKTLLSINGFPHAVYNFQAKRGWCRTGFPPSTGKSSIEGHEWKDDILDYFK